MNIPTLDQIFVGHHDETVVLESWQGKTSTSVALTPEQAVKVARRLLAMAELVTDGEREISSAWVVADRAELVK